MTHKTTIILTWVILISIILPLPRVTCEPRATAASPLICGSGRATTASYIPTFVQQMERLSSNLNNSRTNNFATTNNTSPPFYALIQCHKDLSRTDCLVCYAVSRTAVPGCLPVTAGRIFLDGCFVRYDNYSFFNESVDPSKDTRNCNSTSLRGGLDFRGGVLEFNTSVRGLVENVTRLALNNSGFGVLEWNGVYGLAQCWESLSVEECRRCLDSAKREVMGCLPSADGRGMNAGCFLRYSTQKFYENDSLGGGGNSEMAPSGALVSVDYYLFDVHCDGVFYFEPLRYENGGVFHMRMDKKKKMDYDALCEYLKEKLELNFYSLFFCLPECELGVGLKLLEGDRDVASMYGFADTYGIIHMYMAHIPQMLADFYYQNLLFSDSEDDENVKLMLHGKREKNAGNMSFDELTDWAEEEARSLKSPAKPRTVRCETTKSILSSNVNIEALNSEQTEPVVESIESFLDDVIVGPDEVVNDDDMPLRNLVAKPNMKRKSLVSQSSPTTYVIKKGKGQTQLVNDEPNIGDHDGNASHLGKSVVNDDAIQVKKAVDKGKGVMIVDDKPRKKNVKKPVTKNKGIVIEENVNRFVNESDSETESESADGINWSLYSDSDSDCYSDKSVDYLSEGEDDLIDLRKRKTEAKKAPKTTNRPSVTDKVGSSSGGTSSGGRKKRVYEVGDSETVIEHEEFMDNLMRKLRDALDGDAVTDPFTIASQKQTVDHHA